MAIPFANLIDAHSHILPVPTVSMPLSIEGISDDFSLHSVSAKEEDFIASLLCSVATATPKPTAPKKKTDTAIPEISTVSEIANSLYERCSTKRFIDFVDTPTTPANPATTPSFGTQATARTADICSPIVAPQLNDDDVPIIQSSVAHVGYLSRQIKSLSAANKKSDLVSKLLEFDEARGGHVSFDLINRDSKICSDFNFKLAKDPSKIAMIFGNLMMHARSLKSIIVKSGFKDVSENLNVSDFLSAIEKAMYVAESCDIQPENASACVRALEFLFMTCTFPLDDSDKPLTFIDDKIISSCVEIWRSVVFASLEKLSVVPLFVMKPKGKGKKIEVSGPGDKIREHAKTLLHCGFLIVDLLAIPNRCHTELRLTIANTVGSLLAKWVVESSLGHVLLQSACSIVVASASSAITASEFLDASKALSGSTAELIVSTFEDMWRNSRLCLLDKLENRYGAVGDTLPCVSCILAFLDHSMSPSADVSISPAEGCKIANRLFAWLSHQLWEENDKVTQLFLTDVGSALSHGSVAAEQLLLSFSNILLLDPNVHKTSPMAKDQFKAFCHLAKVWQVLCVALGKPVTEFVSIKEAQREIISFLKAEQSGRMLSYSVLSKVSSSAQLAKWRIYGCSDTDIKEFQNRLLNTKSADWGSKSDALSSISRYGLALQFLQQFQGSSKPYVGVPPKEGSELFTADVEKLHRILTSKLANKVAHESTTESLKVRIINFVKDAVKADKSILVEPSVEKFIGLQLSSRGANCRSALDLVKELISMEGVNSDGYVSAVLGILHERNPTPSKLVLEKVCDVLAFMASNSLTVFVKSDGIFSVANSLLILTASCVTPVIWRVLESRPDFDQEKVSKTIVALFNSLSTDARSREALAYFLAAIIREMDELCRVGVRDDKRHDVIYQDCFWLDKLIRKMGDDVLDESLRRSFFDIVSKIIPVIIAKCQNPADPSFPIWVRLLASISMVKELCDSMRDNLASVLQLVDAVVEPAKSKKPISFATEYLWNVCFRMLGNVIMLSSVIQSKLGEQVTALVTLVLTYATSSAALVSACRCLGAAINCGNSRALSQANQFFSKLASIDRSSSNKDDVNRGKVIRLRGLLARWCQTSKHTHIDICKECILVVQNHLLQQDSRSAAEASVQCLSNVLCGNLQLIQDCDIASVCKSVFETRDASMLALFSEMIVEILNEEYNSLKLRAEGDENSLNPKARDILSGDDVFSSSIAVSILSPKSKDMISPALMAMRSLTGNPRAQAAIVEVFVVACKLRVAVPMHCVSALVMAQVWTGSNNAQLHATAEIALFTLENIFQTAMAHVTATSIAEAIVSSHCCAEKTIKQGHVDIKCPLSRSFSRLFTKKSEFMKKKLDRTRFFESLVATISDESARDEWWTCMVTSQLPMLDEHAQELASIAKYKAVELSQASDNIAETFDLSNPHQLLSEVPLSDALRDCVSGAKSAKVIAMLASHIHSNVTNGIYKVVMNGMPGSPDLETAIPMMIPSELLVANENTTFSEFIQYIEKVRSWTKLALVVFIIKIVIGQSTCTCVGSINGPKTQKCIQAQICWPEVSGSFRISCIFFCVSAKLTLRSVEEAQRKEETVQIRVL
jgi:hypothetical protein